MASGFSGGSGGSVGSVLGFYSPSWMSVFGGTGSLGGFIQEAQLDDFLYSQPAKILKLPGSAITTSPDLPGSTHWDPAPVPVGKSGGGLPSFPGVVYGEGTPVFGVGLPAFLPDFENEGQPPIIYSPPPILLPGQTDPGREEKETQKGGDVEVALTWSSFGEAILGGIGLANQYGQMTSGQLASSFVGPTGPAVPSVSATPPGVPMVTGTCPPRKTRTLTIDCATGQEIPRKRRRRKALLTQGDMGVLFQIASLPNNANVRVALAGAIRR